jgi:hypothetical protein
LWDVYGTAEAVPLSKTFVAGTACGAYVRDVGGWRQGLADSLRSS